MQIKQIKLITITILVKLISFVSEALHLGSGNTWPGYIGLKLYPDILSMLNSSFFKFSKGIVLISGTNGKTTTAKLITHVLTKKGFKIVTNASGANILNGIVSTLLLNTNIWGKLNTDYGVFEVDEFTLPNILKYLKPNILVLHSLSRDQLDRYGEVDTILNKWKESLTHSSVPSDITIIADSTQKTYKDLKNIFKGEVLFFDPNYIALKKTPLVGEFNAKNVSAALHTLSELGFEDIVNLLSDFEVAFGRGEKITFKKKNYQIFLAKNPSSFIHNLDILINKDVIYDSILFILNDKIPDGRDVSWIYDIDPIKLKKACTDKNIFVCGTRFLDMVIRLNYAGVEIGKESKELEKKHISSNLKNILKQISSCDDCNNIVVLPNYSSMLEVRKILIGRKIL